MGNDKFTVAETTSPLNYRIVYQYPDIALDQSTIVKDRHGKVSVSWTSNRVVSLKDLDNHIEMLQEVRKRAIEEGFE